MNPLRSRLAAVVLALWAATLPSVAQTPGARYKIEKEGSAYTTTRERDGKSVIYVTLQFKITRPDGQVAFDIPKEDILVEEDGRRVAELEIQQPAAAGGLSTVLALDVSGSMAEGGKMDQARQAARTFLDRLHERANCGLVLFDHQITKTLSLAADPQEIPAQRGKMRSLVDAAQPGGGTAYLDATVEALALLQGQRGRKAILVMTDGVDLNSRRTLREVIDLAKNVEIPVYTIGVGEPGKNEPVSTVLVLDHSGSMSDVASQEDRRPKIQALHDAACRFIDVMRLGARTTLIPFNDIVERPRPFTDNKEALKRRVRGLVAEGGTLLYDATYEALETLNEENPPGKKAVLVLTDGVDEVPGSRHSVEEVIARARKVKIPLHTLGFGRPGDIDERVLERMARETGGTFHHARTSQSLFEIFESLSIQLHDDGIDEATLRQLAEETGGKYYPARDISKLQLIYGELAERLQTTYTVTFPSQRQSHDGTSRGIDISVTRGGVRMSDAARFDYNVRGLVVPDLHEYIYLGLLVVLGALLVVPPGVRRLYRFYGGS
jgi:VWFA-related protein